MPRLGAILVCLWAPGIVFAATLGGLLPGAEERGKATYRFLGLALYDARLFTPGGAEFSWSADFALELTYLRALSEYDLVEGTLREMKRNGGRPNLDAALYRCFDDVEKGDRFLAVTNGPDRVGFWLNGTQTCWLDGPGITRRFMEIFLGDNTRSRSFTRRLRGS
ncbi:MAG: hypothetical protein HKN18_06315 [Silicimonas sp.]|nr:hypothetical protein [Silicimonas sp.]